MFASKITKSVEIEGHGVFLVRKLNRTRLEQAGRATMRQALELLKDVGGAGVLKDLQAAGGETAILEKAARDPFLAYDRKTLIALGVVGWPGETPGPEEIEDLEAEIEERLAREVYELSRPKNAEERKKD